MNEGATYRGVIKNYAREIVVTAYGLHLNVADADAAPSLEVQAQHVRERVVTLTKDFAWLMVSARRPDHLFFADRPTGQEWPLQASGSLPAHPKDPLLGPRAGVEGAVHIRPDPGGDLRSLRHSCEFFLSI